MLVPEAPSTKRRTANFMRQETTTHKYIRNLVSEAKVISPDDENVKLTESMKKECEGKTIFYNSQHVVEVGDQQEGRETKVIGIQNEMQKDLQKLLPKRADNSSIRGDRNFCNDVRVSESHFDKTCI